MSANQPLMLPLKSYWQTTQWYQSSSRHMAHPIRAVMFQTTAVKCPVEEEKPGFEKSYMETSLYHAATTSSAFGTQELNHKFSP